jgi:gliding motility-associated-like protein
MKFRFFSILLLTITLLKCLPLHAQELQWARQWGEDYNQAIRSVSTDSSGNVYLIGNTANELTDLDPGTAIYPLNHIPFGPDQDVFLVKIDPQGNFLWGTALPDHISGATGALKVVVGNGDIPFVFYTQGFDRAEHIVKKFAPDGTLLATKVLNGSEAPLTGPIFANSMDVDNNNNIYICGYYYNTPLLEFGNPNSQLPEGPGHFVLKLDSATLNISWIRTFADDLNVSLDIGQVKATADGNISYLCKLKTTAGSPAGSFHALHLLKLNFQTGGTVWDREFQNQSSGPLTIAQNGDIVFAGSFGSSEIDVDPSASQVPLSSSSTSCNRYILRLDANGNYKSVIPFYNAYSNCNFRIKDVETDLSGNLYVCANWFGSIDADPGTGLEHLYSDYDDIHSIIFKFDVNNAFDGYLEWGDIFSFSMFDIDIKGDEIVAAGEFNHNQDFDPGSGTYMMDGDYVMGQAYDGFVLKLGTCNLSAPSGSNTQYFCTAGNPTVASLLASGSNVVWYPGITSGTALAPITPLTDGATYYASRTSSCPGIPARLPVTVHFTAPPGVPLAAPNQQFCAALHPSIASIQATGTDIQWYNAASGGQLLAAATSLINGQTYYASQRLNGCESPRTPVNVTVTTVTPAAAAPQQEFCALQQPTLANLAVTGANPSFYDSQNSNVPLPLSTPLMHGQTYYVVQAQNGCESETRIPITVSIITTPLPTVASTQTFCIDQSATVSNLAATGQNIKWYGSPTGGTPLGTSTSLLSNATYYVTQTIDGCESISRVPSLVVIDNASFTVSDHQESFCDDSRAGSISINLNDYTSLLLPSYTGITTSYHNSQTGAADGSDLVVNWEHFNLSAPDTSVYLRAVSAGGCVKTAQLLLSFYTQPAIHMPSDFALCENSNEWIHADAGYSRYKWSTGSTSAFISVTEPGSYWVKLITDYSNISCETVHNFTVSPIEKPYILEINTSDWTAQENKIVIRATGVGNEYSIDGGLHFHLNNTFDRLEPGNYDILVRNYCGTAKSKVALLHYPTFFSPNGDGENELWHVKFGYYEKGLKVHVFDRFGKYIITLDNNDGGWDGTYNGKLLPATDYWFLCERFNGKTFRGHFSLIR